MLGKNTKLNRRNAIKKIAIQIFLLLTKKL